jgi:hypothetical protein
MLTIVLSQLQYLFTRVFRLFPEEFVWLDELCLMLLLFIIAFRIVKNRKYIKTPIDLALSLFLIIWLLSAMANSVPPLNALLGLRGLLQYVIIFYAIVYLDFNREEQVNIVKLILILALFQVPFGLYQFFNPTYQGYYADAVFGTMGYGLNNSLGLYLAGIILIFLGIAIRGKFPRIISIFVFIFILSLGFIVIISGSRQALLIFPLAVMIQFLGIRRRNRGRLMFLVILILVLSIPLFIAFVSRAPTIEYDYSFDRMLESQINIEGNVGGRIGYVALANRLIHQFSPVPFLGIGPGMFASSAASFLNAPIFEYVNSQYEAIWISSHSQLAIILGEYGYAGVSAIFLLLFSVYNLANLDRVNSDNLSSGLIWGARGFFIVFILGIFTGNNLEVQFFSSSFWALAGIVYTLRRSVGVSMGEGK